VRETRKPGREMKTIRTWIGLLTLCGITAAFSGCDDGDVPNGSDNGGSGGGGTAGNAPSSLKSREYQLTEPGGISTITFTGLGNNYTLARPGIAQEAGSYTASRVGIDTWDTILNNSLDGSSSRLVLTFSDNGVGSYSFTGPNATNAVTGQFQETGFGSSTTGTTTTGTTTTGTTTTGGGTGSVQAPATLSQVVINGLASNPSGGGQAVVNISGNTFVYASGGFAGTAQYTPSGTTARLRLNYAGTASGDFDDYTLVFRAPSGSSTLSTFSGTQKAGNVTGPASGTFIYTQ
jgi:hypothetical protein